MVHVSLCSLIIHPKIISCSCLTTSRQRYGACEVYLLFGIVGCFLANALSGCRVSHGVRQIRTLPPLSAGLVSTDYAMSGFCLENYLPELFSDLA